MRGGLVLGRPQGRGSIAGAVAGFGFGMLSAAFSMAAVTGSLGGWILASLAALPLFAAGLGWGLNSGFVAGAVAMTAVGGALGWMFALVSAVTVVLPVWLMTVVSLGRRVVRGPVSEIGGDRGRIAQGPWLGANWLVMSLVAIGAVMVLALTGAMAVDGRPPREEFLGLLRRSLRGWTGNATGTPEVEAALSVLASYPALVVAWMLAGLGVNGVLAQGALTRFGYAIRPNPRLAFLALPGWFAWVTAIIALAAVALEYAGGIGFEAIEFALRNMLIIQGFAYVLAGLGVVHGLSLGRPMRLGLLSGFYAALFLVTVTSQGWPLLAIVVLGLVDGWADFRGLSRVSKNGPRA